MIKFNQSNLIQFYNLNNLQRVNTMSFKNRKRMTLVLVIDKTRLKYLTDKFNRIANSIFDKPKIESKFSKLFK